MSLGKKKKRQRKLTEKERETKEKERRGGKENIKLPVGFKKRRKENRGTSRLRFGLDPNPISPISPRLT